MGHNKWLEVILAVIILIFVFWQSSYSQWIVALAAVVLLVHGLVCKCWSSCCCDEHEHSMHEKPKKSRRK